MKIVQEYVVHVSSQHLCCRVSDYDIWAVGELDVLLCRLITYVICYRFQRLFADRRNKVAL